MTTLRWTVGDVRITRILEVEVSGMSFLIPEAVAPNVARIPWLAPPDVTPDAELVACIQSFAIETRGRRILVDTAAGPVRKREIPTRIDRSNDFLAELAAVDLSPEAIDTVVFTHLHFDHLGWASRAGAPTFPRARYLLAREEWEYWSGVKEAAPLLAETLMPAFQANLVDLVGTNHEIAPGIHLEPTPGHTPGHVCVVIESRGARAVVTGDLIHHPAQMARPEWWTTFDADRERTVGTRRAFLERYAGTDTLIIGTHFPGATAGHVVRDGPAFRFVP